MAVSDECSKSEGTGGEEKAPDIVGHPPNIKRPCCHCGAFLFIDLDEGTPDLGIRLLARSQTLHEACREEVELQKSVDRQLEQMGRKETVWAKICPPEYRKSLNFKMPGAKQANLKKVLAWKYGPTGLIIYGESGLCKTRFAFELLHREFNDGRSVHYINVVDMRYRFIELFKFSGADGINAWKRMLTGIDLLLMDDFGKAVFSDGFEEWLYLILDGRACKNLPTIYTTNDSEATLRKRLSDGRGAPIIRRVFDHAAPIEFV